MANGERRLYIDWARGIAVLLMIEAHTTDAWTRIADRGATMYGVATIVGGFAAPLFLWLAGIGLVLTAARAGARTGSRASGARAVVERGLEIFVLAFLFRLQAFIVSPGGHPLMLFRVDVLNVMGIAMAAAGLAWGSIRLTSDRVVVFASLAAIVALVTPLIRHAAAVEALPTVAQWYLRPAGEYTTFTLFPWAGFVFAGAAAGALISVADGTAIERRAHAGLALAGAVLIAVGLFASARPTIYTVPTSFWTSSPAWFAIRVGVLMLLLAALKAGSYAPTTRWHDRLATLGRASLFVYWIHVELVYGYASWLWRRRLPLWATAIGYIAFTCVMYRAVVARNWYLARRRVTFPEPAGLSQA